MVDWGTVPDWVGGIGTSGSLLLGYYLLLRERRRADQDQIQQLLVRRAIIPGLGQQLTAMNTSNSYFYDISVIHHELNRKPDRWIHWRYGRLINRSEGWGIQAKLAETLAPMESAEKNLGFSRGGLIIVRATDARGRRWAVAPDTSGIFRIR